MTQVSRWLGVVSIFLVSLKKGHVRQRQGGVSESYCRRERHNDRQTGGAGEGIHLSVSAVTHHLSILSREKMGAVTDEWPRSQEKKRGAELSPRRWGGKMIISWLSGSG